MRMWMVEPRLLCDQHLLGEHLEMHMFAGALRRGRRLDGYVLGGLVEVHNVVARHDELAAEMERRFIAHDSEVDLRGAELYEAGRVDVEESKRELRQRCLMCRERQEEDRG